MILQSWVEGDIPEDAKGDLAYFPANASQFARWDDPMLAIQSFSESNWRKAIDPLEAYAEEKQRIKANAQSAILALRKIRDARGKRGSIIASLRAEKQVLTAQTKSLISQLHAIDAELERTRIDNHRLELRLSDANERIASLTRQLSRDNVVTMVKTSRSRSSEPSDS